MWWIVVEVSSKQKTADRHLQNYQTGSVSIFEVARDESMQKNLLHRAKGVFQYIYRK